MEQKSGTLSESVCSGYFSLQWHITNSCDQRCKHCYIFNGSEEFNFIETPLEVVLKSNPHIVILALLCNPNFIFRYTFYRSIWTKH